MKEDRHFVTALARGLEVLSRFRTADRLLGNLELAERCRLPKSTVSRLTYTLTKLGYLRYVEAARKYQLGTATLALGSSMLAKFDVRQLARPLMQELADYTRGSVALATRDRLSMIYVENCRGNAPFVINLDVGSRLPIATTAIGRAYLAVCPPPERRDLMEQVRELDELAWPAIRQGIEEAIRQHAELGVCASFGEWQKDVNAIAIGFQPGGGRPPMAISCGGVAFAMSREYLLDDVKPRLIALVDTIRSSLGQTGSDKAEAATIGERTNV